MSWTYELLYLPRRHAGSYVLVTSRGASVALRIYRDGETLPQRIAGKDLPSLRRLYAEARAAGKPIHVEQPEDTNNAGKWWVRISRANRAAGLAAPIPSAFPLPTAASSPAPKAAPAAPTASPPISTTVFFTNDGRALRSISDWQALHPARHWKAGYSAMELARAWHAAQGLPPAVAAALSGGPFGPLVVEKGIAECLTAVPGAGRPSHTDLMVEARSASHGRVVLGVEGKVHESFGPRVGDWLNKQEPGRPVDNKVARLEGLCDGLGLRPDAVLPLRYQLLHRSWATLAHGRSVGAAAAVLLVHALGDGGDAENLSDYQDFLRALGATAFDAYTPVPLGPTGGLAFWAVWVRDRPLTA